MTTFDDRHYRKMIAGILRDLAEKVDRKQVEATLFEALPIADCPPGYAIHKITFKVRKS